MKKFVQLRVSAAWLLLAAIVSGGGLILIKVAVLDAPPQGSAFVLANTLSDGPSATITPFAGASQQANSPSTPGDTLLASTQVPSNSSQQSEADLTPTAEEVASVPSPATINADSATVIAPTATMPLISVYVSGEEAQPGVYTLPDGSRIVDAVSAAGGALPDADMEQINLAQKLSDEDHISVYKKGEAPPVSQPAVNATRSPTARQRTSPPTQTRPPGTAPPTMSGPKPTPGSKINLNSATAGQLEQIPGIGPALAQRIISDREQNGPFKSVEDLTRISGIKEGILARLRDYLTVGP